MAHLNNPPGRLLFSIVLACFCSSPAWSSEDPHASRDELAAYIARPDPDFGWREITSGALGKTEYTEYLLTSQAWRGTLWKHQLYVLRPRNMAPDARHGLLFIHGGRWKPEYEAAAQPADLPREAPYFARLAESIRAPVAVLRQVPFQPLFDRREDALIAYTFDQYLQTGDAGWPILLPMVKSATRAMDAVQNIARQRWNISLETFTVTGASKRGWTAWLTAATDPRVMAVAPMVIDVLNMRAQMDHQRATWGDFSDEIRDYSTLDIQNRLQSERGDSLLSMVDPFSYRQRLSQPKLILLSTNDRYWPLDALNIYWPGLPDPKNVMYVPNQGHGLHDANRVINGLSALHRYAAAGKVLPRTTSSVELEPHAITLAVESDRPARRVLLWSARSPTLDFREAHWSSHSCTRSSKGHRCSERRPDRGYAAAYAETFFRDEDGPAFSTTTTVCIFDRQTPACR
ncbi:PhoPQ-activated pathogenicity-related family protein [Steroidobacter flavus]|uniref:PhoPQ-activated pathogenicity-related family protein n=1 Tax=Steroidobacter flavus TaxID=1842136 RepID=A0ABV8SKC9_9GAMM